MMYSDEHSPVNRLEKGKYLVDLRIPNLDAEWQLDQAGNWRLSITYDKHIVIYLDLGDRIIISFSSELSEGA